MAGEWDVVRIGDVSDLFDGPHHTAPLTPDGPVIYLNVGDIRGGRIELRLSGRVSEETARSWSRRVLPEPGDVVFGYEATLGEAALLNSSRRWCLGRRVGLLRPRREKIEPRFLAYSWYSPAFQETLRANCVGGSTIESIRLTDLPTWSIELPRLDEQRAIAHILGTLDDKIELNRQMSETLEAMARALFKSWFVDFDPVRARTEGSDTSAPARFGDLVDLVRESDDPRLEPDTDFLHYSLPAFDQGRSPQPTIGAAIKSQKTRVPPGTVLLSKLNPEIERVWLVDVQPGERAISSTEFLVLQPRAPIGRGYLYCLTRSPNFRRFLEGSVTGTSRSHQRVQPSAVLQWETVRPPGSLIEKFESQAGPLLERSLLAIRESRTLAALRDALLPKLISGELRIKDAERFVSDAVA